MPNRATVDLFTSRNRRQHYKEDIPVQGVVRFDGTVVEAAAAPLPEHPPRPFGDLSRANVWELCAVITEILRERAEGSREKRRQGLRILFQHLESFPGDTWQERWEASGFNEVDASPVSGLGLPRGKVAASNTTTALAMAFGLRVIKPSLSGLRANRFAQYAKIFRELQKDPLLDEFFQAADAYTALGSVHQHRAKYDLACALTTQGIALEHMTPSALLHYSLESKRLGLTHGANNDTTRYAARGTWQILHKMGHFPEGTAPTLRGAVSVGQRTVEELVDRYEVKNPGVRQLLIDYLTRRKAGTDYTTLEGLARYLVLNFWVAVEHINPGQKDLTLSEEVYDQFRAELGYWTWQKTKVRTDPQSILLAVRGFYVDLHSWAIAEPEKWAQWVAPCPVRPSDLKGFGKRRRAVYQRMADRTRVRQPLLPVLIQHVEARREHMASLLEAARPLPLGAPFVHRGRHYSRTNSQEDRRRDKLGEGAAVRVLDHETGKMTNLDLAEDQAFWEWAVVEVLRHSGIRIEELTELSHLSVRQYQRPNGEVIALLVIAPSKSERERVIPMSADLFHAIAQIIRRQTRDSRTIGLLRRYDCPDKTWSEEMPFLFQRRLGTIHSVMAPNTVVRMLERTCKEIGQTNPAFAGTKFTPHDFRRLFATEIVNGGLPIHIGAALLGHLNLQTTQGYVAVFAEDVIGHYQRYLDHRRSQRPDGEYGDVTAEEWTEFEDHFDKRKVELGNCARPYGTPCRHEHACIRCPVLQINPKMVARLNELEKDLLLRRQRAEAESWLGEIDGIDQTLVFLRSKRDEALRSTSRLPVDLGLPQLRR